MTRREPANNPVQICFLELNFFLRFCVDKRAVIISDYTIKNAHKPMRMGQEMSSDSEIKVVMITLFYVMIKSMITKYSMIKL